MVQTAVGALKNDLETLKNLLQSINDKLNNLFVSNDDFFTTERQPTSLEEHVNIFKFKNIATQHVSFAFPPTDINFYFTLKSLGATLHSIIGVMVLLSGSLDYLKDSELFFWFVVRIFLGES